MSVLDQYSDAITKLCATHKVKSLYAFGSILNGAFNSGSDIDLLVDFDLMPVTEYADNYYGLKFSLQDILKRPIDLIEEKAIRNPYFKLAVSQNRQLVYEH